MTSDSALKLGALLVLVALAALHWLSEESRPSIRVVFFDLGGVLASDLWDPLMQLVTERMQLNETARRQFRESISALWNVVKVRNEPSEDWFWHELLQLHPTLREHFSAAALGEQLRQNVRVFYATVAIVERLHTASLRRIGMLSNHQYEWFEYILQRFQLRNVFDQRLLMSSHAVGCAKPSDAIYTTALERARVVLQDPALAPVSLLFIDDKPVNVEAARRMGWNAIHYDARVHRSAELVAELQRFGVDEALESFVVAQRKH